MKNITFLKQKTDTYWPFHSDCVSVQLKAVKFDSKIVSFNFNSILFHSPMKLNLSISDLMCSCEDPIFQIKPDGN